MLKTGERVPADCLVLKQTELEVKLPAYMKQETQDGESKAQAYDDRILFADSYIFRGKARALVTCVGDFSSRTKSANTALHKDLGGMSEIFDDKEDLEDMNEFTALEKKLQKLSDQLTYYSLIAAGVLFLFMIIDFIILVSSREENEEPGVGELFMEKIPLYFTLVVIILVVSIPEGLTMTVTMAIAYSTKKMYRDAVLVKSFNAPEKIGGVDEIIVGKTGTLTDGDIKVAKFYCEERIIKNSRKDTFLNCDLQQETIQRLEESILYNTDAYFQMGNTQFLAKGDYLDKGLLKFLQDADLPVQFMIKKKFG